MSTLPPPTSPRPPTPPLSARVQQIVDKHKLLSIVAMFVGLGVFAGAWSAVSSSANDSPGSPGGGSKNRATLTSCKFSDGWVEASGTAVRVEGGEAGITVNLLVNGRYVDRDYLYDPPVGETQYWSVSEPDVQSGTCTVDVT